MKIPSIRLAERTEGEYINAVRYAEPNPAGCDTNISASPEIEFENPYTKLGPIHNAMLGEVLKDIEALPSGSINVRADMYEVAHKSVRQFSRKRGLLQNAGAKT